MLFVSKAQGVSKRGALPFAKISPSVVLGIRNLSAKVTPLGSVATQRQKQGSIDSEVQGGILDRHKYILFSDRSGGIHYTCNTQRELYLYLHTEIDIHVKICNIYTQV